MKPPRKVPQPAVAKAPAPGPKATLLVLLKAPVPGRVKTRLAPKLGDEGAARAYVQLAVKTRGAALASDAKVVWVYEGDEAFSDLSWLGLKGAELWPQPEGDLGERLAASFAWAFEQGAERVCAIGVDCPSLSSVLLQRAFRALDRADVVLGPAQDGGYYLIGLKGPRPELFKDIPWSTSDVLTATVARAHSLRLKTGKLPTLADVDTPEDYARWKGEPPPAA